MRRSLRVTVVFAAVCCVWFFVGFFEHSDGLLFTSIGFAVAKGGGYLLDFLLTVLIFPVMKNLVSFVRSTPLRDLVPLDNHAAMHATIAKVMLFAIMLHVGGHYAHMTRGRRHGWHREAYASLSGLTGHIVLLAMVVM